MLKLIPDGLFQWLFINIVGCSSVKVGITINLKLQYVWILTGKVAYLLNKFNEGVELSTEI